MAFMKDILTHNIPIWEECAATPFVQETQSESVLRKFKKRSCIKIPQNILKHLAEH